MGGMPADCCFNILGEKPYSVSSLSFPFSFSLPGGVGISYCGSDLTLLRVLASL